MRTWRLIYNAEMQRHAPAQVPLQLAPDLASFERSGTAVQLGLAGAHQRLNAAMAVQLCRLWASHARAKSLSSAAQESVRSIARFVRLAASTAADCAAVLRAAAG